jgi:hypothetical protein
MIVPNFYPDIVRPTLYRPFVFKSFLPLFASAPLETCGLTELLTVRPRYACDFFALPV